MDQLTVKKLTISAMPAGRFRAAMATRKRYQAFTTTWTTRSAVKILAGPPPSILPSKGNLHDLLSYTERLLLPVIGYIDAAAALSSNTVQVMARVAAWMQQQPSKAFLEAPGGKLEKSLWYLLVSCLANIGAALKDQSEMDNRFVQQIYNTSGTGGPSWVVDVASTFCAPVCHGGNSNNDSAN